MSARMNVCWGGNFVELTRPTPNRGYPFGALKIGSKSVAVRTQEDRDKLAVDFCYDDLSAALSYFEAHS